jgi:hypothetical protein
MEREIKLKLYVGWLCRVRDDKKTQQRGKDKVSLHEEFNKRQRRCFFAAVHSQITSRQFRRSKKKLISIAEYLTNINHHHHHHQKRGSMHYPPRQTCVPFTADSMVLLKASGALLPRLRPPLYHHLMMMF